MTAEKIIQSLGAVFAPMDAEVLAATKEWALGRVKAIKEFKASEEAKAITNSWVYYEKIFAIAGGKTWYTLLESGAIKAAEKHCAAVAKKRNASIATKLSKLGVTEVISEEFVHTVDGFNGLFVVDTDNGKKRVAIETIRAGGYNIQCLHLRVLVKVN